MDTQVVVLLGHSLLIDGVAASLAGRPGLHTVRMDLSDDKLNDDKLSENKLSENKLSENKAEKSVWSLKPNFVIFEFDTAPTEKLLALFDEHPGVQFVGIHPEYSRLLMVSGYQHLPATMNNLVAMLETAHLQPADASDAVV